MLTIESPIYALAFCTYVQYSDLLVIVIDSCRKNIVYKKNVMLVAVTIVNTGIAFEDAYS